MKNDFIHSLVTGRREELVKPVITERDSPKIIDKRVKPLYFLTFGNSKEETLPTLQRLPIGLHCTLIVLNSFGKYDIVLMLLRSDKTQM